MKPMIPTPKLRVNEIFYSLQGEGARKGSANIFVRLAHCNLTCGYCDTEFESYRELSLEELLSECGRYKCPNVVFTGGEPLLQLTEDVATAFKDAGYFVALETNGSERPPKGIDYVAVSPKVAEHVVSQKFEGVHIHELRYVRNRSQGIPRPMVRADHYFLSPEFNGEFPDRENIEHCIRLVKEHPEWSLSVQEHKLLNIR